MAGVGGRQLPGRPVALLILLGGVLVAALGPLIASRWGRLRRWRLPDRRTVRPARHVGGRQRYRGRERGSRARYTDPPAWREAGYACLLATVVPALCVAALFRCC